MPNDTDLDRQLHEAGEIWRAGVAIEMDVEARTFLGRQPWRAGRLTSVSLAVAVGVVSLGVLVSTGAFMTKDDGGVGPMQPGDETASGAATAPGRAVPTAPPADDGLRVVATGTIGVARSGDIYVCTGILASRGTDTGCGGGQLVKLTGVDGASWAGKTATVHGVWSGDEIRVTDVAPADAVVPPWAEPAPCAPPSGGWPVSDSSDAAEAASYALEAEVRQNPDSYVGLWTATAPSSTPGPLDRVIVVGTVDDVDDVRGRLTELYPYSLCVVASEFSRSQLDPVVDELLSINPTWRVEVDPRRSRVVIDALSLDASERNRLLPLLDKVELRVALLPDR